MDIGAAIQEQQEVELSPEHRALLRDWYDQGGRWSERMSALYRIVEQIASDHVDGASAVAWEQGWVARGNDWAVSDNPHGCLPQ